MSDKPSNKIYIAIIKTEKGYYALLNGDRSVCGFHTLESGLESFEEKYNSSHRRGYEASMSACINHIMFQPSIITIASAEEIRQWVPDPDNMKVCSISNISGSFCGLLLEADKAESVWSKGTKPRLIS